jgi:hypothetical protein
MLNGDPKQIITLKREKDKDWIVESGTKEANDNNKLKDDEILEKVPEKYKSKKNGNEWKSVQKIKNKYPDEKMPSDGVLYGIAEIKDGLIQSIGNKGNNFNEIDFVVTTKGELIIGKKHHFLGNALEVEAAGTLKIVNGKVKKITNASGHYLPSVEETLNFEAVFKNLGINTTNTALEIYYIDGNKLKSTTKFLK